jgi:hypothetical protein
LESTDPRCHRDWLATYGLWEIGFTAADSAKGPRFLRSMFDLPVPCRTLEFVRPSGHAFASGPKRSQARRVPAEINLL